MTDQEAQTLEEAKKYFEGFPEAPYSDSFKWVDSNGFEHLSTVRAWTGKTLLSGVQKATLAIAAQEGKPVSNRPIPAPVASDASQSIPVTTEDGLPVVNAEGKPQTMQLPAGVTLYQVAGLFHGKTQNGKDYLGVRTIEQPYSKKWGVKCFHPNGIAGWNSWPVGEAEPVLYAPPANALKVIIREPKDQGGFADVVEFRAA